MATQSLRASELNAQAHPVQSDLKLLREVEFRILRPSQRRVVTLSDAVVLTRPHVDQGPVCPVFEGVEGCVVEGKMYASNAAVSSAKDAERSGPPSSLTTDSQLPLLRSGDVGGDISCSSALLLHTPSNG